MAPVPEASNHLVCVWVFAKKQRVVHVDDTVNYFADTNLLMKVAGLKKGEFMFHPSLKGPGFCFFFAFFFFFFFCFLLFLFFFFSFFFPSNSFPPFFPNPFPPFPPSPPPPLPKKNKKASTPPQRPQNSLNNG